MKFGRFHFGSIAIDGVTYKHDVVIDCGKIRKRRKRPSRKFREQFGHTPVSVEEKVPWKCRRLVIGTSRYGSLPVMHEQKSEAHRRKIELVILPIDEAIEMLVQRPNSRRRAQIGSAFNAPERRSCLSNWAETGTAESGESARSRLSGKCR